MMCITSAIHPVQENADAIRFCSPCPIDENLLAVEITLGFTFRRYKPIYSAKEN